MNDHRDYRDYAELEHLHRGAGGDDLDKLASVALAPLFTREAYGVAAHRLPSRGVLGSILRQSLSSGQTVPLDPRLYLNTKAPWSALICGAPGSGISHTVSCVLETCLLQDRRIGTKADPITTLIFHYDGQMRRSPCDAAHLGLSASGSPNITVLVSPGNLEAMTTVYESLPNVSVKPLQIQESALRDGRILSLMGGDDSKHPLYKNTAISILRSMGHGKFAYTDFKDRLKAQTAFSSAERVAIQQRLGLLETFFVNQKEEFSNILSNDRVVIVDLTDPLIDGPTAAVLFDFLLKIFNDWKADPNKLLVLNDAHNYLSSTSTAPLAQTLLSLARMRSLKLLIATQEPTVIPRPMLDLLSFTICHRLSSPAWYEYLRPHMLLGDASGLSLFERGETGLNWFQSANQLHVGQALVISPSALVLSDLDDTFLDEDGLAHLGSGHLLVQIRQCLSPSNKRCISYQESNEIIQHHSNGMISQANVRANGGHGASPNSAPSFTHPPMFGSSTCTPQFFGHSPTSKFFSGGSTRHPSQSPETQHHSLSSTSSANSHFQPLTTLLETWQANGIVQPSRDLIAGHLLPSPPAGVDPFRPQSFDDYLQASVSAGVVESGVDPVWNTTWYRLPSGRRGSGSISGRGSVSGRGSAFGAVGMNGHGAIGITGLGSPTRSNGPGSASLNGFGTSFDGLGSALHGLGASLLNGIDGNTLSLTSGLKTLPEEDPTSGASLPTPARSASSIWPHTSPPGGNATSQNALPSPPVQQTSGSNSAFAPVSGSMSVFTSANASGTPTSPTRPSPWSTAGNGKTAWQGNTASLFSSAQPPNNTARSVNVQPNQSTSTSSALPAFTPSSGANASIPNATTTVRPQWTFQILIKVLKQQETSQPKLSVIAQQLKVRKPNYLAAAGFSQFKEYAMAAAEAGVVTIGGKFEDQGWISLRTKGAGGGSSSGAGTGTGTHA